MNRERYEAFKNRKQIEIEHYKRRRRIERLVVTITSGVVIGALLFGSCGCRWYGTAVGNGIEFIDNKIDDATNYEKIKKVEDTCRAMISSYEADKLTYEQYKNSDNEEKQSWAEQAKMRANKTAATYNNYILENNFVWAGNVPLDIKEKLEYIN